jgi:hypothetical protein
MIVFSGLEIFGYPIVDVLLLGLFLFFFVTINQNLKTFRIKFNLILIFCIYMILQVMRGMYVLNDYRMIYWVFFFIVLYFSHIYLNHFLKLSENNFKFTNKVFNYSSTYLFIYGIIGFLVKNPDDFQGIYWVGSSVAFIVIIPYICSHFLIFKNSGYTLSGLKIINILFCLAITVIHHSRTGLYFLFLYMFLLLIHVLFKNPKRLIMVISFLVISVYFWDFTARTVIDSPGLAGQINSAEFLINDSSGDPNALGGDLGRFLMIQSIYNKFFSSTVDFLFGSGWYTSRQTLKPFEMIVRNQFGLSVNHLEGDRPLQVITLAAIISDTGIIGLILIMIFFIKSSLQIFKSHSDGRMIIMFFLLSNWVFYLVGYTFVSILSFLLFFPDGILVNLVKTDNLLSTKLVKKIHL